MTVPSLFSLSQQVCLKNVRHITDLSNVPTHLLLPILHRIDNPHQLMELEKATPSIKEHTWKNWRALIERDLPEEKKDWPQGQKAWSEWYWTLREKHKNNLEGLSAILAMHYHVEKTDKEQNSMQFRNKIMAPPKVQISRRPGVNSAAGQQQKGRSLLDKARKEAKVAKTVMTKGMKRPGEGTTRPGLGRKSTVSMTPPQGRGQIEKKQGPAPLNKGAAEMLRARREMEQPPKPIGIRRITGVRETSGSRATPQGLPMQSGRGNRQGGPINASPSNLSGSTPPRRSLQTAAPSASERPVDSPPRPLKRRPPPSVLIPAKRRA